MRSLVGYIGFRIGVGVAGLLPLPVVIWIGETLGKLSLFFLGGRRRMALAHARRLGVVSPEAHVRRVFAAYGRYWAETFWVRPRRRLQIEASTTLVGGENIQAAQAEGRGVIFAIPHLGNWELAGPIGQQLNLEVVAVAENLANARIRDWFVGLRAQMGIDVVIGSGKVAVTRELEAVLARNGGVALLCDRDLSGKGVQVDFFGETTTLPGGPASLAVRSGARILPVGAYFGPHGTHRVVVNPPITVPDVGTRSERIRVATTHVAAAFEELISAAPEQWHLLQPNWPSDHLSR